MSNKRQHSQNTRNNSHDRAPGAFTAAGEKLIKEMVAKMSIEDLDTMARDGSTALATGLFSKDFQVPPDKGHWKFRLVPSSSGWDHRSLVLMPDDNRTRAIWTEGQIKFAQSNGLTNPQARVWARSSIARRHELIQVLGQVMQSEELREAYLEYGEGIKDEAGFDYHAWSSKHGIKDGLSVTARKLLVDQIKELLNATTEKQNARHPGGNGIAVNPIMARLFQERKEQEGVKRNETQGNNKEVTIIREPIPATGGLLPAHMPAAQDEQLATAVAEVQADAAIAAPETASAPSHEHVSERQDDETPTVESVAEAAPQISSYDDDDIGSMTLATGVDAGSGEVTETAPAVVDSVAEGQAEADVDIS